MDEDGDENEDPVEIPPAAATSSSGARRTQKKSRTAETALPREELGEGGEEVCCDS